MHYGTLSVRSIANDAALDLSGVFPPTLPGIFMLPSRAEHP